jgi:dipeptidyl aminopeptidase/acylaminoacyl peptidase
VSERRPWLERLAEVPGLLLGGAWLDPAGAVLGADRMERPDGDRPRRSRSTSPTAPGARCSAWPSAPTTGPSGWADAHVEQLQGAAGPVEAIVYGGRDWRASERVLLALHGGPLDAWRLEFDPLFQLLARAGIAIVAPNQRGSSGYLPGHALALRGAWGGPDLEDVRRIALRIAAERGRLGVGVLGDLALLGLSYGAFLALLAASCEPELWSCCVALAPFLSGPRLYRDGDPAVRGLLERLGGCQELHDALGPRDLLRLVGGLRARLLLVHGGDDEVIPVAHSRALRQRLLDLGRREGEDFDYLEVPSGGHDLVATAGTPALREHVVRFLTGREPAGGRPAGGRPARPD